jgi:hypothetical protein
MITKEIAMKAKHGNLFFHKTLKQGSRGHRIALRVRVTGKCQMWIRTPNEFRLPVKHGLYESWAITHDNCNEWMTKDPTQ